MPLIIEFIQGLIQKEAAYAASNGDVYFSVISDEDYGKLSGRKLDDMQAGARIEVGEAKDHPMDFALWKAPSRVRFRGTARGARDVPAGTSNARQ